MDVVFHPYLDPAVISANKIHMAPGAWNPRSINWDWEGILENAIELEENQHEPGHKLRPFLWMALPVLSLAVYNQVCDGLNLFLSPQETKSNKYHPLNLLLAGFMGVLVAKAAKLTLSGDPIIGVLNQIYTHGNGVSGKTSGRKVISEKTMDEFLSRFRFPDVEIAKKVYLAVNGDEGFFLLGMVLFMHYSFDTKLQDFRHRLLKHAEDKSNVQKVPVKVIESHPKKQERKIAVAPEESGVSFHQVMNDLQRDIAAIDLEHEENKAKIEMGVKEVSKKMKKKTKIDVKKELFGLGGVRAVESREEVKTADDQALLSPSHPHLPPKSKLQSPESTVQSLSRSTVQSPRNGTPVQIEKDSPGKSPLVQSPLPHPSSLDLDLGNDDSDDFRRTVDMLQDLFPAVPLSELKILVQLSGDIDELIEYLFEEQECHRLLQEQLHQPEVVTKVYAAEVHQLKEMFPNIDIDAIEQAFELHHADLESTTEFLLSNVGDNDDFANYSTPRPQNQQDTIENLLGVPPAVARAYLLHSGKLADAICEILLWYRAEAKQPEEPTRGRRVQRGTTRRSQAPRRYQYRANSPEAIELKDTYNLNPELQTRFTWNFMAKTLEFFQGSPDLVLPVMTGLIDHNLAQSVSARFAVISKRKQPTQLTKEEKAQIQLSLPVPEPQMQTMPKTFAAAANEHRHLQWSLVSGNSNKALVGASFANYKQQQQSSIPEDARNQLERARNGQLLDLHGFTVGVASTITRLALNIWWAKERQCREEQGQLHKYGLQAVFVSPLSVITGRGLHSAGGVPVVRMAVQRLLKMGNYVYDERVGAFVVEGKRDRT